MKQFKRMLCLLIAAALSICFVPAIPVFAAIPATVNGVLDIEAEDLPWDPAYLGMKNGDIYSANEALFVLQEEKTAPQPADPSHLDASFKADKAGTYTVWVRGTASYSNSAGRSIWVSVNNAAYKEIELRTDNGQPPKWMKLFTVTAASAGQDISVRIRRRQNYNIALDRFYITDNAAYTPDDTDLPLRISQPIALTPTNLTSLRNSLNGWYGMTAAQVLADCQIDDGLAKQIYYADGSVAAANAPAVRDMYVRVSKTANKYVDYPLVYEIHRVGEVTYSVFGANGAKCWEANGYKNATLNATVTIDSFTEETAKEYTLIIAQKKNNILNDVILEQQTIGAKGTQTLAINHPIPNGTDISYDIYLWDNFETITPLKKGYLVSPKLAGKKMATFGDSITNGFLTYPSDIALINGMEYSTNGAQSTLYNVGVGGARMAYLESDSVKSCSMVSLVDTFTTDTATLSAQQAYLTSPGVTGWTNSTFTYGNMVALKENITAIDYATVFYGTNDFTSNVPLENPSNLYDTATFAGATRHSVEALKAKNPQIQILLIAPMYRDRQGKITDSNTDLRNSDDYPNGIGLFLREYGAKLKEIAASYDNVYFYDMYEESGINKYNQQSYFYDGLHPISPTNSSPLYPNTSPGHRLLASKISHAMQMFFR